MAQDCQIWEVCLESIESSLGNQLQGPGDVALWILGSHGDSIHIGFAMPRDDILDVQGAICRGQIYKVFYVSDVLQLCNPNITRAYPMLLVDCF